MAGKFEIKKGKSGQFRFNLKAANHKIILSSETYHDKADAKDGIQSVKKHAGKSSNYERKTASNGQLYFVLKAVNGEVIGKSETYKSASGRNNGIASVKKNAPGAKIVDLTA